VSVAPSCFAVLRFSSCGSIAMMRQSARDARALDDRLADAAAAEDRDAGAGLHLRGVERRADAGRDAAPDECELRVREVRLDRTTDDSATVITSAKVPRPVMQKYGLPSGRVPRICIDTSGLELAQLGLLAETVPARAARGHEGRDDAVRPSSRATPRGPSRRRGRRPRGRAPCRAGRGRSRA